MIIKLIPENEFEKGKMGDGLEHTGVKEFFMFGNKKDKDGDLMDFSDWNGSYRYLEGSLYHFMTTITEEKISKTQNRGNEIDLRPQTNNKTPFIKKGTIDIQKGIMDNDVQIINVEELNKKAEKNDTKQLKFESPAIQDEFVERTVSEENMEAEDKL